MTRKLREKIDFSGAIYHIVCRGMNKKNIFRCPKDYKKMLEIVKQAKKKFGFYIYSYNLLPNHVHFEIKIGDISISIIMHYINTCYAGYFNQKYKRSGHLFQERFYSSLIDTEFYFWAVSAYIDLNAVRAGLVKKPEDYQWGSYQFYYQRNYNNGLVDCVEFLKLGGEGKTEDLCQDYIKFVEAESKNPKRPKFIQSEKFI